jgi:DNA-binding transcriptional ArsR family regulator
VKPTPTVEPLVVFLGALADETRLRLVIALAIEEKNVTALRKELGKSQPTVSHHLGKLRDLGIVETRRNGKSVIYSLTTGRMRNGAIWFPNGVSIDVAKGCAA